MKRKSKISGLKIFFSLLSYGLVLIFLTGCTNQEQMRNYLPKQAIDAKLENISTRFFICSVASFKPSKDFDIEKIIISNPNYISGSIEGKINKNSTLYRILASASENCVIDNLIQNNKDGYFAYTKRGDIFFRYKEGDDAIVIYDVQKREFIIIAG